MVEHSLAKAEVEGSSPSFRSWLRRSVVTSGVRQGGLFSFFHRDWVGVQCTVLYRKECALHVPSDVCGKNPRTLGSGKSLYWLESRGKKVFFFGK